LGEGREGEASEEFNQRKRRFPLPNSPPYRGRGLSYAPLLILISVLLTGCGNWAVLMPTNPNGQKHLLFLLSGIPLTLLISFYSIIFGSIIGLGGALMLRSRHRSLRWFAAGYVDLFRKLPLYVVLLWIYFGFPTAMRDLPDEIKQMPVLSLFANMTAVTAATVGLSLNAGAFLIEVFRAGIESVSRGQVDAAYSFGMSRAVAMRRIVLPQALRRMLPPTVNQYISVVKDSSLAGAIGVLEITRQSTLLQTQILHALEIYTFLGVQYFVILTVLTWLARYLERKFPQYS
jgi:His/Glu/Gln/Arg/opine family amino acid ABC transporter permease subunit